MNRHPKLATCIYWALTIFAIICIVLCILAPLFMLTIGRMLWPNVDLGSTADFFSYASGVLGVISVVLAVIFARQTSQSAEEQKKAIDDLAKMQERFENGLGRLESAQNDAKQNLQKIKASLDKLNDISDRIEHKQDSMIKAFLLDKRTESQQVLQKKDSGWTRDDTGTGTKE